VGHGLMHLQETGEKWKGMEERVGYKK
jgi:hypothetical protein